MTIKPWEERLDDLDTSKGVSNKMIQACMLAEIKELRKALRDQEAAFSKAMKAQHRVLTTQIKRQLTLTQQAKQRATEWRAYAYRYQKLAAGDRA